jgi:hypothetical protein
VTDEIVAFIKARLAEAEARALAAQGHQLFDGTGIVTMQTPVGTRSITLPSHIAEFATYNDPAQVLREVEAKRQLLERCQHTLAYEDYGHWLAELAIQALAAPHADHKDYKPWWRPE